MEELQKLSTINLVDGERNRSTICKKEGGRVRWKEDQQQLGGVGTSSFALGHVSNLRSVAPQTRQRALQTADFNNSALPFIYFPRLDLPSFEKEKKKKEKERKKKGPRGKGWSGRVINADTLALLHLARENSRIAQRRGSLRASGTGFVVDHAVVTATDGSYFPSRDPRQISNERLVTGLELFEGRDI